MSLPRTFETDLLTEHQAHIEPALPAAVELPQARQRHVLVIVAAALIGLVVLFIALRALLTPTPPVTEKLPPDSFRPTATQLSELKIAPAQFGVNAELLRATGLITVDGDHSTPILLPFSGQVSKVLVEAGQHVVAGQPLLEVASPELVDARNALLTGQAQVASTQQAAALTAANEKRQKAIYDSAGGALKDYLQAKADSATAAANLRAAQSAVAAARGRLGLYGKSPQEIAALGSSTAYSATIYRSPVSGTVAERAVAPGQFITAGGSSALLTIADLSRVWLVAQLSQSDAELVRLGDAVEVTTPALPGRVFHARIDNIGTALDPNTHRLPVRASVENPGELLKPELFASFTIRRTLGGNGGVLVPAAALIHEGDTARVWVLGNDRLLHAKTVSAAETEGGMSRITSGLQAGDRVVISGALFVNEAGAGQ
jgi:cobalt-zinc-cadmium efflux system membrane fusion protein